MTTKILIFYKFFYLNSEFIESSNRPFNTEKLNLDKLNSLSKINYNKGNFWDIIDPKVSWEFLIGIFLSILIEKNG